MVECQICKRKYKQLTSHLIRTHKVTCEQYREKFPGAKITCDELVNNMRSRMLSGQAEEMARAGKGCKKPNLSKKMMGNQRGLGSDRSAEKERYRQQALKQHAEGNFGTWDDDRRKRQAEITAERWRNGSLKHVWKPQWHLELAQYFCSKDVNYIEEYIIPLDKIRNGQCSKPFDFYLPDWNLLIDLNGCFWHGCSICYEHHHIQDRVKKNDSEKESIAKEAGYQLLKIWEHDKDKLFRLVARALEKNTTSNR